MIGGVILPSRAGRRAGRGQRLALAPRRGDAVLATRYGGNRRDARPQRLSSAASSYFSLLRGIRSSHSGVNIIERWFLASPKLVKVVATSHTAARCVLRVRGVELQDGAACLHELGAGDVARTGAITPRCCRRPLPSPCTYPESKARSVPRLAHRKLRAYSVGSCRSATWRPRRCGANCYGRGSAAGR